MQDRIGGVGRSQGTVLERFSSSRIRRHRVPERPVFARQLRRTRQDTLCLGRQRP
jgi:hypothetical protein